ncbi:MAG: IMPACT family protein [Methanosarcinaceae archaeon]|nr:IMPACT family protein [Methanosarcinaceae archaeon]
MESYKTLKGPGTAQKEFKNSGFLGYASPVKNEAEAKAFVKKVKELHPDANHNVSAYLVKDENSFIQKYDDDGEPAGSSGKPVFRVLELKEINNAAVVVTRYFGGVKLGYGGLSRAYRETAVAAVEAAGIIEVFETLSLKIRFGYPEIQRVKQLVENYGSISEEGYSDVVEFTVEIKKGLEEEFVEKLVDLTKNRVEIRPAGSF